MAIGAGLVSFSLALLCSSYLYEKRGSARNYLLSMTTEPQKPNWKTSQWWLETFGLYRDERIDDVTRNMSVQMYWVYAVLLAAATGYLLVQRHWSGLVVGGILAATLLYVYAKWRSLGGNSAEFSDDEFAQYQYKRSFFALHTILVLVTVVFWLAPVETPINRGIWAFMFSVPAIIGFCVTSTKNVLPTRTIILTFATMILGGLFGFSVAVGNVLSQPVIIGIVVVYIILLIINIVIWWRQRKW